MRVLWVTPWFPSTPADGRFNFIYRSAVAVLRRDIDLRIVLLQPWLPKIARIAFGRQSEHMPSAFGPCFTFRVIRFPRFPRLLFHSQTYYAYRLLAGRQLRREIRAFAPDVVHAHTDWAAYAAVPAANATARPVIVTLHACDTTPAVVSVAATRNRLARTLASASRVLLVGTPVYSYLRAFSVDERNVSVVPNGFSLPEDVWKAPEREWSGELRVISVSVLYRSKSLETAILAFARIRASGAAKSFDIIGDGPERSRLEHLVRTLGLSDSVRFHGALHHDEALRRLNDAHVFLLPSYSEAFGVAYLEAMGAGLVTIGVKGQGPTDFILDGHTGFLVPPHDVTAIVDVVARLASDREFARRVASAGRQHARSAFTWERHAEKLVSHYSAVIATAQPR